MAVCDRKIRNAYNWRVATIDERTLTSFVVLAQELHFLRAAARLGITQPALSQQIARLEAEVGATLFQRSRRKVALTDAGDVFLRDAHAILGRMQQAVATAKRAAGGQSGRLSIGFVEATAFTILPQLVSSFQAASPDVALTLTEMVSTDQAAALRADRIDIGLLRPIVPEPGLTTMPLMREAYVVALARGHWLAEADAIDPADLAGERFLMTPPAKRRYLISRLGPLFRDHGFVPTIVQEVDQLPTMIGLVGCGIGIAIVPASVAKLTLDNVVYRPLAGKGAPKAELCAAWSADRASPLIQRFVAMAVALSQQHGQGHPASSG